MKTNLVIGSEGFIGIPFCRFLKQQGEQVVHFDIKRSKKEDARTQKLPLKDVDIVYFLAWDVGGSKYLYQPGRQKLQFEWNLSLMQNVFRQLEKTKKQFIFVSSQLAEEGDTVYGATKRLGEIWTGLLGGVCIRVWNAYGVMEEEGVKSHVISDFIYQAIRTKTITMMTNGLEWRQFTHVSDLSRAFYMAANTKDLRQSVYDASSYEWIRILDIANIVADLTGAHVIPGEKIGHNPLPASNRGRIPGWLPEVELRDGIQTMVKKAKKRLSHEH